MKFLVYKTTDDDYCNAKVLDFNTIESLMAFQKKKGYPFIISENNVPDMNFLIEYYNVEHEKAKSMVECEYSIEIYNDYRE